MKDREKLNIYSIFAIFMLITIVVSASFAFFGKFNPNLNGSVAVNINASSPGNASFVVSSANLNLVVPASNMTSFDSSNTIAVAEDTAIINVSLLGTSSISTRCTYDIVFEYDKSSNIYGVSPTTKTSGADKEITFEVEGPVGTSNPFGGETNIDYNTAKGWIAKTSTTGAKVKLVTGARITNDGSTESTQTFKITARYYNLDAFQSQLAGKAFTGKIYAENLNCEGVSPDAEDFIKSIAAEGLKPSSQDASTFYTVVNENGYRFEGRDPDNYICLDNNPSGTCAEDNTFRIIGVFDEKVGTSETDAKLQSVIKIIKSTNYTSSGIMWDTNDSNNWDNSSLKTLLNGTYLTSLNSYKNISKVLSTRWSLIPLDFNTGRYIDGQTAQIFYNMERYGSTNSSNPTYTYAKVGLMYPSDYMYGVMASDCARTALNYSDDDSELSYNNYETCSSQNWLYNQNYIDDFEWTISPESNGMAYMIYSEGSIEYGLNTASPLAVRPTLYIDANVKLTGTGSLKDPYRILN